MIRLSSDLKTELKNGFQRHLNYSLGRSLDELTPTDAYISLSLSLRDLMMHRLIAKRRRIRPKKRVYYLSMEFLMGKMLNMALVNMNLRREASEMLEEHGYRLEDLLNLEPDAALGNGGLGRLAACFLDSMASLDLPCFGAGLCYEFGLFKQSFVDGAQQESPDVWLAGNYPWLIDRHDKRYEIRFYGHVHREVDKTYWHDGETIIARARDMLIPGEGSEGITLLRLWWAEHSADFRLDYFQHGDYIKAMAEQVNSESISKVLYPNDSNLKGLELRLKQEYFLASATIQDALANFKRKESDFSKLPDYLFFQLNDTHPAVAIAELQRLLVDREGVPWSQALELTRRCMGYTNHTIMPEALEKWNLDLFGKLLPRHLEIIYDINFLFLKDLRDRGFSEEEIQRASIIEEGHPKRIRMAALSVVGSSAVNGVSALHSDLVKTNLFPEYARLWPQKFSNKTNGIAFRRWLVAANPPLTALINEAIGDKWHRDHSLLKELMPFRSDSLFRDKWQQVRDKNKGLLYEIIQERNHITLPSESFFDVHVKRIHEYKRQLLNLLRIARICLDILAGTYKHERHRTFIFAGKAAPGYQRAKLMIRLAHALSAYIEKNPLIKKRVQLVFLPNFSVSLAERIYPASDLSEQISTAGTEASGTGNMKFMLNGVVTFGTLDGANIEIGEEVGPDNIYIFGKKVEELRALHRAGYNPVELARRSDIAEILNFFEILHGDFREFVDALTFQGDGYFHLADFDSYMQVQEQIISDYDNQAEWIAKGIANTACSGKFSADRTVEQYAREIWQIIK
ncbi:MAG: glycogen/starch/alpha-glucan phosphorylase [Leptospiraceae bacterium]|nr:glycogen/starch/alpha-glucan phosphorylase [Leptospiraceae bacterium]